MNLGIIVSLEILKLLEAFCHPSSTCRNPWVKELPKKLWLTGTHVDTLTSTLIT